MKYLIRGPVDDRLLKMFDAMESDPDDVIVLDIFSTGGDMYVLIYGINVIQRMRRKGKKIVTVNSGVACSAGATLLSLGDWIYCYDASLTLYHMSVFYRWQDALFDKLEKLWLRLTGSHSASSIEMLDHITASYEPWKYILKAFGDKNIRGDYMFTAQEMEELLDNVVVGDLPDEIDNLQTWCPPGSEGDDEMIIGEIPADVQEAIAEATQQAEG